MSISAIVHMFNEDPIVCELEELPSPEAQSVTMHNPRRRDGKEVHFLDEEVATMIVPWHRILYIQVLPSTEIEDVIGFVREER
jgi:hypothetical protein